MFLWAMITIGKTQILRQMVVRPMTCHQGNPGHTTLTGYHLATPGRIVPAIKVKTG
jgi:hypothetical protein